MVMKVAKRCLDPLSLACCLVILSTWAATSFATVNGFLLGIPSSSRCLPFSQQPTRKKLQTKVQGLGEIRPSTSRRTWTPYSSSTRLAVKPPKWAANLPGNNKEEEDDSTKKNPENDDRKEGSGFMGSLNFWSSKKDAEEEEPREDEGKSSEAGILGFFNRGTSEDDEKRKAEKQAKKKLKKDKKKQQKEKGDDNDSSGFLKGITSRFGGTTDDDDSPEESEDDGGMVIKLPDNRPTFVTFQRTPQQQTKLPKPGSRIIPPDISAMKATKTPPKKPTPPASATRSASQPKSQSSPPPKAPVKAPKVPTTPAKPLPMPKPSKTRRILQTVTSRKGGDQKDGDDNDKDSLSVMGRVQQMFSSSDDKEDNKNVTKGSDSTSTSVALKFMSNLIESSRSSRASSKEQWVPVCPKTRLSPGEIVPVEVAGLDLIVVASKDAQNIYCMVNSCPHLGTPLEIGFLERRPIEANRYADKKDSKINNPMAPPAALQESDIAAMLANDGCEDCIVCPLHKTAFALKSGEVRGEWCPYPPVLGKMMATVKNSNSAAVFDVRTRGKNIEVRLNTPLLEDKGDGNENIKK